MGIAKNSHKYSRIANKNSGQMSARDSDWCSCMIMFIEILIPIGSYLLELIKNFRYKLKLVLF